MSQHRSRSGRSRSPATSLPEPAATPWLVAATDLGLWSALIVVPCFFEGRTGIGMWWLAVSSAVAAVCWSLHQFTKPERTWRWSGTEWLWLAAVAVVGLQLWAAPPEWFASYSPKLLGYLPAWSDPATQKLLGERWSTLSVTPDASRVGLAVFASLGLLFITTVQRLETQADIDRWLQWCGLAATGMAVVGLLQYCASNDKFLWIWPHPIAKTSSYVMAVFPNRNHAAHYFVLGIGPLLWWWARPVDASATAQADKNGFGGASSGLSTQHLHWGLLGALGLVVMATLMTLSRGGLVTLGIAFAAGLFGLCRCGWLPWKAVGVVTATGAVCLCVLSAGTLDSLADRLQTQGNEIRTPIWAANVALIRDFPWIGTGVGSHSEVYHPYLDSQYDGSEYTHAECSYLQVGSETGVVGLAIAGLMILYCLRWTLGIRASSPRAGAAAVLFASLAAHLVHAAVDFLWYAPGLMTFVAIQMAAACRLWQLERAEVSGRIADQPASRLWWTFVGTAMACVALCSVRILQPAAETGDAWEAYRVLAYAPAYDASDPDLAEMIVERQREELKTLLKVVRSDPGNTQASLAAVQALLRVFDQQQAQSEVNLPLTQLRDTVRVSQMGTVEETRDWMKRVTGTNFKLLEAAWNLSLRTVRQNPFEGQAYVFLAELSFLHDASGEYQRSFLKQAAAVRPFEPLIHVALAERALADGDEPSAIRHWQEAYRRGGPFPQKILESLAAVKPAAFLMETFQPNYLEIGYLVSAYTKLGNTEELPALQKAYADASAEHARRHPSVPGIDLVWSNAAEGYHLLNDDAQRFTILKEAIAAQPQSPLLSALWGRMLYETGRYQEAIEPLRTAVRRNPDDEQLRELADDAYRQSQRGSRSNIRRVSHQTDEE